MEIDKENEGTIKKAFDYFLKHETLSKAAKELNNDGVTVAKFKQGGGRHRLGFFTVDVLHRILKNKAYAGIKGYSDEKGERKEATAVWKAIINPAVFERVQEILRKNRYRKKPFKVSRFPYLLSGLTYCKSCGDSLCGASAFGKKKTRYNYYVHGWASKKGSTYAKETFKCNPHRVPAGKLEKVVLKNIHALATDKAFAEKIMERARKIHAEDGNNKEIKRLQSRISGYKANLDALVERLAELPKSVSASLIYKQMEKLEDAKKQAVSELEGLQRIKGPYRELPADFRDFRSFTAFVGKALKEASDPEVKAKIIKRLIHKVEVGVDRVKIHYFVGEDTVGSGSHSPRSFSSMSVCSGSLTNGGEQGIRTPDTFRYTRFPSVRLRPLGQFSTKYTNDRNVILYDSPLKRTIILF